MEKEFKLRYFPSIWFKYVNTRGRDYYCQTDGLLFDFKNKLVTILEMKYNHTSDAYFQLLDLYVPVVRRCFPAYRVAVCEVVHWFDRSVPFPCSIAMQPYVDRCEPGPFHVHILSP